VLKVAAIITIWCSIALAMANPGGGDTLAERHGCLRCHAVDRKIVGPAYRDVATKYQGKPGAVEDLAPHVERGSAGVWGFVPMPPQKVEPGDLKVILEWVLSQEPATAPVEENPRLKILPEPRAEPRRAKSTQAGSIEVIEFFTYRDEDCAALEPILAKWARNLPRDVFFRRIPVRIRPEYELFEHLFFTLEKLHLLDSSHLAVFHDCKDKPFTLEFLEKKWLPSQGLEVKAFMEAFYSFAVRVKALQARRLQELLQVASVPLIVVAGKYRVPFTGMKAYMSWLRSVDAQIAKVREEQKSPLR
jgi:cytochrome c